MSKERGDHPESIDEQAEVRRALEGLFENVCDRTREKFLSQGEHEPLLLVMTRLGLAVVRVEVEPGMDRERIAREIGENIRRTAIKIEDEPVYDEPMAFILVSEAWVVEYDKEERKDVARLPPSIHPKRKEILQVTLRSPEASFCRNWPIVRRRGKVTLGEPADLSGEGMESVWDVLFTGEASDPPSS